MPERTPEADSLTPSAARGTPYLVVEGPIGVGKTTLARRLADHYHCQLLLERAEENPFLERFYQDPRRAALPTQLHFLFQRMRQVEELRQGDLFSDGLVADFMLAKERLFAGVTLGDDEYKLYDEVYTRLGPEAPNPDLVIFLQAPVSVLLERIARRGRAIERQIDSGYLQRLVDAYNRLFYHFDEAPLLIVNAAEIDLSGSGPDFARLLAQVDTIGQGRHYFNPLPVALA
jgi:deoxyadenosine/deoxycytidine kinase